MSFVDLVLVRERFRQSQRLIVQTSVDELEVPRELVHHRVAYRVPVNGDLIDDAAGGVRIPIQFECVVDGHQHITYVDAPGCYKDSPDVGALCHDALTNTDEFLSAPGIHTEVPRTVLSGDLTN